jgi:hypothetical protein
LIFTSRRGSMGRRGSNLRGGGGGSNLHVGRSAARSPTVTTTVVDALVDARTCHHIRQGECSVAHACYRAFVLPKHSFIRAGPITESFYFAFDLYAFTFLIEKKYVRVHIGASHAILWFLRSTLDLVLRSFTLTYPFQHFILGCVYVSHARYLVASIAHLNIESFCRARYDP